MGKLMNIREVDDRALLELICFQLGIVRQDGLLDPKQDRYLNPVESGQTMTAREWAEREGVLAEAEKPVDESLRAELDALMQEFDNAKAMEEVGLPPPGDDAPAEIAQRIYDLARQHELPPPVIEGYRTMLDVETDAAPGTAKAHQQSEDAEETEEVEGEDGQPLSGGGRKRQRKS